jgi:hypothetical protein
MTAAAQRVEGLASAFFADDEPVYQSYPLLPGEDVPAFGCTDDWPANAVPRAANVKRAQHNVRLYDGDASWNLRIREVVMAQCNPTHPALRRQGIFRSERLPGISSLGGRADALRRVAVFAVDNQLPERLGDWRQHHCDQLLAHLHDTASDVAAHKMVVALRLLHTYAPVLTDGGLAFEPWPGRPARQVAGLVRTSGKVSTPPIPPQVYWPLIKASWTYIDVFSDDILAARAHRLEIAAVKRQNPGKRGRTTDEQLRRTIDRWAADPSSVVPLMSGVGRFSNGKPRGSVNWSALDCQLFGGARLFITNKMRFDPLRRIVNDMVAGGRCAIGGYRITSRVIDKPDGTTGPWHGDFDAASALHEEHLLRCACFIFGLALSAMRDSEWQEVRKGALIEHYGAPAVRSSLHKGPDNKGQDACWWIIDPVAKAVRIAEQLTWHDEYVWAGGRHGNDKRSRVGVDPYCLIDCFIREVNANRAQTALTEIPPGRVRPHMFRRTFAVIAAHEPGGEIALGIMLKHAARRAVSNAVTGGYYADDPAWAKEFDDEHLDAAVDHLVELAIQRRCGQAVAIGPGAERLHARLDQLVAQAGHSSRANVANDQVLRRLLATEFPDLHLGNLNHCMYQEASAECRRLVRDPGISGPLIDMCMPGRCPNSIITDQHVPIWESEHLDLVQTLKQKKLAPGRRVLIERRLAEVDAVLKGRN